MAGSPYIKPEPNDGFFDPNQYMQFSNQQQFNTQQGMNINPANLSQSMQYQSNMASSYNMGNSGIADDELLELDFNQGQNQQNNWDFSQGVQNMLGQHQQMNQQNTGLYSHTPDGAPMQSPYTHGNFNYAQFRPMNEQQQQFMGSQSLPQQPGNFRRAPLHMQGKISNSRSPNNGTPTTPALAPQHIGDDVARCIALSSTDGLRRGIEAFDTGEPIKVPVGEEVLGRMFNVIGDTIDEKGPVETELRASIHRAAPPFEEQDTSAQIFETGIKVIDLIAPYTRGGKVGLFGGAGVPGR